MTALEELILKAIREAVKENVPCSWKQISDKVKAHNLPVTNWLKVRGVLQYMLDSNEIRRLPDIRVEEYVPFNHIDEGVVNG